MYIRNRQSLLAFVLLLVIPILFDGCGAAPTMQNSGCSACQFLYAATNSGQILTFPVNRTGGVLGTPTSIAGPANSGGLLTMAPASVLRPYLYVSDPQNNAIQAYAINSANGTLSRAPVGPFFLGSGNGAPGEMISFGNVIYVASSTGNIVAFSVNTNGSLTAMPGSPFAAGMGLSHMALVGTGTTSFLYAANSGDANGSISAFNLTPSGGLVPVPGSPFPTLPGAGPEGFLDVLISGKFLYVALSNANAVAAFTIANDGSLTPLGGSPFPAGRGTFSLNTAGGFLLATNNLDGTISSYSIDSVSGTLTPVAGSPFPAVVASGDTLYLNGTLFVPDTSSNSVAGFASNANGTISSVTGSPFQAGAGPVALTSAGFPAIDPP